MTKPVYCVMFKSFSGVWSLDRIFETEDLADFYIKRDVNLHKTAPENYRIETRLVLNDITRI